MKRKCRGLLLAWGCCLSSPPAARASSCPLWKSGCLPIYNGEVSVEEAEARGWLDKEFNDWIQSMMEQASVIGSFEASNLEGEPITGGDLCRLMISPW